MLCMCTVLDLNWWPQFNLQFVHIVPHIKNHLHYTLLALFPILYVSQYNDVPVLFLFHLPRSLGLLLHLVIRSFVRSFGRPFVDSYVCSFMALPCFALLVNVQVVRTRFCVFTFLSLDVRMTWWVQKKKKLREKQKQAK